MMLLSSKGTFSSVFDMLTVILIFVMTLVLAYLTAKFIGKYQKNRGFGNGKSNKNIEVIETFPIAQGKYIQILRIGEKYVSIAVGKDTITMLTEHAAEELLLDAVEETGNKKLSFKDILDKARNRREKNK